ncbi:MAG: (2Fe-2S)-binding protein [Chlorobiaceae bacterium]|jgi:chlorosome envelope protein X|nr:(2Fe-2S)-binding protein [Chlorobiaceae bacterium]
MNITINNKVYEANVGDRLLDIARKNHAHIGYFCGGNSICQTCYVKVLEGADLLSPLSDSEKALLSDNLIHEGTRMACLTTIEKPGTINIVSTVEEVKQMFEANPVELVGYAGKMGREALVKFPDTMRIQAGRKFDLLQLISDVLKGIGDAITLIADALQSTVSPAKGCGCSTLTQDAHTGGHDTNGTCVTDSHGKDKKPISISSSIAA